MIRSPKERQPGGCRGENAFAKLKALLRKAAQRSVEGLWAAIAAAVSNFSPQECANFFTAAGYDSDAT